MHVLETEKDLLHDHLDLVILAQLDLALAALPLDVLRERLIHELLHKVQPLLIKLDAISAHYERTVTIKTSGILRCKTAGLSPVTAHVARVLLGHEGLLPTLETSEGCARPLASRLCDLIESLQDLNFALLKCLLLRHKLVLEALERVHPPVL